MSNNIFKLGAVGERQVTTCLGRCRAVLAVVPESEHLHAALRRFIDKVFLELPESNAHLWREAAGLMNEHIGTARVGWKQHACDIWFNTPTKIQDAPVITGVIQFQARTVYYERTSDGWHARAIGEPRDLPMSAELSQAIKADQQHQESKRMSAS